MNPDIRWKQRFDHLEKALGLLREALSRVDSLSDLEKEGTVQRFEFTFELAWKTLKDYLEHSGVVLEQITPANVIKQGFSAKIISNGQAWIEMLRCRNLMSHTYDQNVFDEAVNRMACEFLPALNSFYEFLKKEANS